MIRGIYTAAAGMLAQMISTDTLANNLANVSTTGFKKNQVNFQSFPELMLNRVTASGAQAIGSMMTGSKVRSTAIDFRQGVLRDSGNPLDVAIEGNGFLTVQSENGDTAYTRNGCLTVNSQGFLTTQDGQLVMGQRGPIEIPQNGDIKINPAGEITVNNNPIDRLVITQFENQHTLEKIGNNLYNESAATRILPPPGPNDPPGFKIHQGRVEGSNTNPVTEMVNSITGLRMYEALQKNIHLHNEALGKAVNDVGMYR
jgi:flagellar basal-body rod protein FlgF